MRERVNKERVWVSPEVKKQLKKFSIENNLPLTQIKNIKIVKDTENFFEEERRRKKDKFIFRI